MTNELSREEELIGKYLDYEICFVGNQPAAASGGNSSDVGCGRLGHATRRVLYRNHDLWILELRSRNF
jgi:hypothetical protein